MKSILHEFGPAWVSHATSQCKHCHCTNREASVIGMECSVRAAKAELDIKMALFQSKTAFEHSLADLATAAKLTQNSSDFDIQTVRARLQIMIDNITTALGYFE